MMIKPFLILAILLAPVLVSAQKAYQTLTYRCVLDGRTFELKLADGYLAASKIKRQIFSGHPVMFYPESGMPDVKSQLTFHATGQQDYFILDKIKEIYDYTPKTITGYYWSGKTWSVIKFIGGR